MTEIEIVRLVFFFFVYCFIGWIIESTYVSSHEHKFVNRGFMRGPFIPIYGSGAMMLLICSGPFMKWPVLVFIAGMIGCSVLEYFTGAAMEAIFKVRYWDYSDKKFNLNGHICLFTSLCWGGLSVLLNYVVHKPVAKLADDMGETALKMVTLVIAIYFIVDLTLAFKAAFDLRNLIIKMEELKKELVLMERRLDVMIAYAGQDMADRRDSLVEALSDKVEMLTTDAEVKFDEVSMNIGNKLNTVKDKLESMPQNLADNIRDEYYELRAKYKNKNAAKPGNAFFKDYYRRGIFLGNPSIKSVKFKDTVEALKGSVRNDRTKNEGNM